MKSFIVFALLVAAALAAPVDESQAQIVQYENENNIDSHSYRVKTDNGIEQSEEGQLKNAGSENEAYVVRGQYSYTGPDGVVYTVTYTADENGFQAQGAHLPVAP